MKYKNGKIVNANSLDILKSIETESVDMILTDPPYNTTDCKWDKALKWEVWWDEWRRIIKQGGTIAITAQMPFSTIISIHALDIYRHKWVWQKDKAANFQCLKGAPYKITEDVLIFCKGGYLRPWNDGGTIKGIYNPQMRAGSGASIDKRIGVRLPKSENMKKINKSNTLKGNTIVRENNSSKQRYPHEILKINLPKGGERIHPTQKPLSLFEYLIKTYTNEGQTVLDCFAGSMTTAIACIEQKRNFICIEQDEDIYKAGKNRIEERYKNPSLFD